MKNKRKLDDIAITAGVGITTTYGGIELIQRAVDVGDKVAPHIEKYVGLIGSNAFEYGLPVLIGLGVSYFVYTAAKATDRYLLEQRIE